ncbi:acyl-CoA desaturase [Xanthovirga aplysinae]|uniref:acyl-CoA desaturase n=1 Tax=Xanthovirga aplysinae TaxID=2529853 RepID=UPI0012BB8A19|nr:acyl-CoA desaturase [Xanthovirga aplysinae]MTI33338.1 acyl-CoA desaturase [Xanthovirga aplysinae]
MIIIGFFIAHWYLSLFFQTFFLHRYSAHRAFTMSKRMEKVFYFLTFIFQGSSYLSAYAYGALHRMHHAYADTEKDPHSPMYSKNLFHMMWLTYKRYTNIFNQRVELDKKFTKDLPEWHKFDRFASHNLTRLAWGVLYTLFFMKFATSPWMYLLLPFVYLMSPVHGAIINWFAHIIGYINFKVSDTSKNFLPFDFLMFGESYHNNHHTYGSRANFGGVRWHEIDPAYLIILLFDKIGIIKLRKKTKIIDTTLKAAKAAA